ncbi:MAG: hypothetical protein MJ126_07900 [Lachnospiraceae bacterium]|nr:hypothetical protein [Lachnospiraceae bacterium]
MTLLIAVFAAIASTIAWYLSLEKKSELQLGFLSLMFWGASLMWFVDAVVEYIEEGAEYFNQAPFDMLNDAYLGLVVVALGMVIWLVSLIIKDPKGLIKSRLIGSRK